MRSKNLGRTTLRSSRVCSVTIGFIAGVGSALEPAPALSENWHLSASASATETYTSNVNYSARELAEGDFATSIGGALQINGEGARLKVNGSIGGTATFYASQSQNNSFAPQVSLNGTLEAIEKFAWIEARAYVSQTFISPFGAQPGNLVNATQNRYTQQTYAISPYIQGVLPSSNVSYSVRDDNYWTVASSFGNSSTSVPNTYSNNLSASMNKPANPLGWSLSFNRSYYGNGITGDANIADTTTYNNFLATLDYQIDPQLQVSGRAGYQSYSFAPTSLHDVRYGIGVQWSPTDRTHVGGFVDHEFFGTGYQLQISHRLPNAALSANFSRGLTSYPQLALAIPAGATVSQFVDAAFTTRIPDPAARAAAVAQFLANSGLPPTLASPVDFYATSLTLQQSGTVSLVLTGALNSVSFSLFRVESEAISGAGSVLPPALQFGQNYTQTGGGVGFSHRLSGFTALSANLTYSTTTSNATSGPVGNSGSKNGSATLNLGTQFGPKTTGSAGLSYSQTRFPDAITTNQGTTSALNVYATVSHTF